MSTIWRDNTRGEKKPALRGHIEAEAVVVGGGLTGIAAAYLLAKEGKKVAVLEKKTLGDSVTAYTTAFITQAIDTYLGDLVKMFGQEKARAVWQSGGKAIDLIERIINQEEIDCDFKRVPEYFYALLDKEKEKLKEEVEMAQKLGFAFDMVTNGDVPFITSALARLENQAKFHPLKYCLALREKAEQAGATFYEGTEATEIAGSRPVAVRTPAGSVTADYCLVATYDPFNKPKSLFAHKGKYISYVIAATIPTGSIEEALYLDLKSPYQYFRIERGQEHDLLILGGADVRSELPMEPEINFKALDRYLKSFWPELAYEVTGRWSGPILEPSDGLPFIGRLKEGEDNMVVATAFSGNGMTYSHIAACIFRDIVLGRGNDWEKLYDPKRGLKPRALWIKGKDYTAEFFGGAVKNYLADKKRKPN